MSNYRWLTDLSQKFLEQDYLTSGQTIDQRVDFICNRAEEILKKPGFAKAFKENLQRGWYSLSTPIWTNFGTDRGLPISCITGDTWVNTKNDGGKQARDICVGDEVLTHKGRYRKVSKVMVTKNRDNIYKLKVGTRMTDLYLTENHLVLTNFGWIRVDELDKKKHLIATNRELELPENNYRWDILPYCNYETVEKNGQLFKKGSQSVRADRQVETVSYYANPNRFIDIDVDVAWALGLWFAEGSISTNNKQEPNGIRIALDSTEQEYANKWLKIFKDKFNVNGNYYLSEHSSNGKLHKWINVNINSVLLGRVFASFGNGCKEKTIPQWMVESPKHILSSFYDGLMNGDGHKYENGTAKITLANPKLILQVYQIGLKLGLDMSLQMQEKAGKLATTRHVYTIVFRQNKIGVNRYSTSLAIPFSDGLYYCPIRTLEKTTKIDDVYDFTVEEDHSFSAAGVILHNCFGSLISDSMDSILYTQAEVGMMTKMGGGTSAYFGKLRERGASIKDNGKSSGSVHFMQLYDKLISVISQGSIRRGNFAAYLDIDHKDIVEFLTIRSEGSPIQDISFGVCVPDYWMEEMISGDKDKRAVWAKVLESRSNTGFPYIFFTDNANKGAPDVYKDLKPKITHSNLCVSPETKILTSSGYIKISELEGQNIEVWNGKQWSKTTVVKTSNNSKLIKINFSNGQSIECTPYHKFYIQRGYKKGTGKNKLEIIEKRAIDLCENDKIIKFKIPVIEFKKTMKDAYTQGFFTGDGCRYGEKILLNKSLVGSFAGNYNYEQDKIRFSINNSYKKFEVPLEHSIESRVDWLSGLSDSDGTIAECDGLQALQIGSVNLEFLKQVQLMVQTLGVNSKITLCREEGFKELPDGNGGRKEYFCQKLYRLLIGADGVYNLGKLGFKTKRLKFNYLKPNRNTERFVFVESIEDNNREDETYCVNEPIEHKVVFNGILTGNCTEIMLPDSEDESFVCDLSSMNILYYDEWKNTNSVELLVYFLDAVMTEFIEKANNVKFMQRAVRFAERHRALGIGWIGWHSFLQSKMIPFESIEAKGYNVEIAKNIKKNAYAASKKLAEEYGEPETLVGHGRRNTTLLAIAPTKSSSFILGQVSEGIEPNRTNYYIKDLAKGKFTIKNKYLEDLLQSKDKNTQDVWNSILKNGGSVQHLDFLSDKEKAIFKTFAEISQREIIIQTAQRQKYIDQGQSTNLMIHPSIPIKDVNALIIEAWKMGIKSLYYQIGVNAAQNFSRNILTCSSCES